MGTKEYHKEYCRKWYKRNKWRYDKSHTLLSFQVVHINIPRKFLKKLLKVERYLTKTERLKSVQKLTQIDRAINKLLHAKSIVEKILNKTSS